MPDNVPFGDGDKEVMTELHVVRVGAVLAGTAGALFLLTWFVMARFPSKVLLGGVEALWLRCLVRAVYVGLLVIVLGVLNKLLETALFWR
jgi:hypothetical protein